MSPTTRYVVVDVETTGLLRPGKPRPIVLEVAAIACERDSEGNWTELGSWSQVLPFSPEEHEDARGDELIPDVVEEMHAKSGLWEACADLDQFPHEGSSGEMRRAALAQLDDDLCRLLDVCADRSNADGTRWVWVGNSPAALDRPVLFEACPKFYARVSHHTLDVSALARWWKPTAEALGTAFEPFEADHRAYADAVESIRLMEDVDEQVARAMQ